MTDLGSYKAPGHQQLGGCSEKKEKKEELER